MLTLTAIALLLASDSAPLAAEAWLEAELHRRDSTVTEWHIKEVLPPTRWREVSVEHYELGPIGARTLVVERGRDATGRSIVVRRWFAVAGFAPGVVATRAVAARTALTAELLTVAPVDRMAGRCPALSDMKAALAMWLVEARHKGEPICASMLIPPPAVARGGSVSVEVIAGAVALHTTAIARADGYVGDRVGLYRLPDRQMFFGVVTAPGEVRIND